MAAYTALESVFDVESFINEYYGAWSGTDEYLIMSYYASTRGRFIPSFDSRGAVAYFCLSWRTLDTVADDRRTVRRAEIQAKHVASVSR